MFKLQYRVILQGGLMGQGSYVEELDIFSQDLRWLSSNLDNLRTKYENKYVLVHNKNVVLSNANYDILLSEAENKKIDVSKAVIERIMPKNVQLLLLG
jgi:hypothetical protein